MCGIAETTGRVTRSAGAGCSDLRRTRRRVSSSRRLRSGARALWPGRFLRGYQLTDADGQAKFVTVYPGWYRGRTVHAHFTLRLFTGSAQTYEFTSQFSFDESVTDSVHAGTPYASHGSRDTRNTGDGIYDSLSSTGKSALTLATTRSGSAYDGVIHLGLRIG